MICARPISVRLNVGNLGFVERECILIHLEGTLFSLIKG